jgi:hypothetical protein
MPKTIKSAEATGLTGNELLVTVEFQPNWIAKLFGAKSYEKRYRGSCTVWFSFPDAQRASSSMEVWLCGVWKREKWRTEEKLSVFLHQPS